MERLFGARAFKPAMATAVVLLMMILGGMFMFSHFQNNEISQTGFPKMAGGNASPSPLPATSPSPSQVTSPEPAGRKEETEPAPKKSIEDEKRRERMIRTLQPNFRDGIARSTPTPTIPDLTPKVTPAVSSVPATTETIPNSTTADLRLDLDKPLRVAVSEMAAARHLEQAELLLRAFRNVHPEGSEVTAEVDYEKRRAQALFYQNVALRREADNAGDLQLTTLLDSLEPILLDIANLPAKADNDAVEEIKDRMERKNLVPLLQVNSTLLARAND
jgi:hypothetical protein